MKEIEIFQYFVSQKLKYFKVVFVVNTTFHLFFSSIVNEKEKAYSENSKKK